MSKRHSVRRRSCRRYEPTPEDHEILRALNSAVLRSRVESAARQVIRDSPATRRAIRSLVDFSGGALSERDVADALVSAVVSCASGEGG